jgi:membrane-associated phospholipid phosphatase
MLITVLIAVSIAAGVAAWACARAALRRWWGAAPASATATVLRYRTRAASWVRSRLEADVATGLALTLALLALTAAGIVVAALAISARRVDALHDLDSAAALWAHRNEGPDTRRVLDDVTTLATTQGVAVIAVVVGAIELVRVRSWAIPAFLAVVTLGDSLATNAIKEVVARARPTIEPAAAALGPSFPSGHSSTAAAFFAALALLAGRRRSARARAALAGVAVGVAVAVACSRVMLDLHWVSDVVAGLALGWGWFAVCAIAFGGWLLEFGEPVQAAARARAVGPARPEGTGN